MTMADMADLADARRARFGWRTRTATSFPRSTCSSATRDAVGVDDYNSYLPLRGLRAMRDAVAKRFREDFGLEYDPEGEIVITSGAGESMLNSLLVTIDPGDKVLLTNPTYWGMAQRMRLAGGEQVFATSSARRALVARSRPPARGRQGLPRTVLRVAVHADRDGVHREETQAIADAAVENDADRDLQRPRRAVAFDGREVVHPATLPGLRERTIVVGSHVEELRDARLADGLGGGAARAGRRDGGRRTSSTGSCRAGSRRPAPRQRSPGRRTWQRELRDTFQAGRDAILEELAEAPGISAVSAEGGYYCLANVEEPGSTRTSSAGALLADHDVAVTPMRGWGSDDFGRFEVRSSSRTSPRSGCARPDGGSPSWRAPSAAEAPLELRGVEAVHLDHLAAGARSRGDANAATGTESASASSAITASFARPRSGAAATRTFQPSP